MNRNQNLDSAKGILIFLVVLGHLLEPLLGHKSAQQLYHWIYLFHMPAFVFISGMLTKPAAVGNDMQRIVSGILAPLLLFTVLYELLHYFLNGSISGYTKGLAPYWILWFLLSLIFWRIGTPLLLALRWPLLVSLGIALCALTSAQTGYYLSLARSFSFWPFFIFGMLYGQKISAALQSEHKYRYAFAGFCLLIAAYGLSSYTSITMLYGSNSFPAMKLSLLDGLQSRLWLYAASSIAILAFLALSLQSSIFSLWGRQSLHIYLWHGLAVMVLRHTQVLAQWVETPVGMIWVSAWLAVILCIILSSRPLAVITDRLLQPVRFVLLPKRA